jgi:type 2 lantibiotic biosynthesis protein LanM
VLSTGLLPRWQEGRWGELRNVGALGGGRSGRRLEAVWRAVNSDAMVRVRREVETPVQPNVPVLEGEPLEPSAFLAEVVAGLTEMYGLLLRHRGELLGPRGPLDGLAGRKTRLILRSTAAYRKLLARSLSPDCCRDGAARGVELEFLARVYLETETRPAVWPLLAAERRALEQADVPLFLVPVAGMDVEVPEGGLVSGALETSSLAAVRENVLGLGEEDLRRQISFLRAALAPKLAVQATPGHEERAEFRDGGRFLAAARVIAERLHDLAVLGADGSAAWIGPRYFPGRDVYELAALGPDLYGGTAGIALFLAAFGHAAGDGRSKDLALRVVDTLRRSLGRRVPRELGIGGLAGIASVLYALVWIGELLGEERLIQEALTLSARLDSGWIAADRKLDVVFGSAGAILGLLALDRVLPAPNPAGRTALEIAGECADHLLARRSAVGPPPRGWPSRGEVPLAGFAHGATGISYALLRLYERTGRRELRDAAGEGLAFDRQLSPARGLLGATWCRGVPGIALARLATLGVLDSADLRKEIDLALEITRAQPLPAIDHLCCGNFGRVEVLLEASRILGDPGLLAAAREIAVRVLARTASSGRFGCVPGGGSELTDPSLFRGEAGIGFSLLRLAGSEDLPCVLRLQ